MIVDDLPFSVPARPKKPLSTVAKPRHTCPSLLPTLANIPDCKQRDGSTATTATLGFQRCPTLKADAGAIRGQRAVAVAGTMEAETSVRVASPQLFVTRLATSPACTHQIMQTIRFRHAHFTARLPVDYRYTPSHFWLMPAPVAADEHLPDARGSSPQAAAGQAATGQGTLWRIGFTKFATRMLGELVEMVLEVEPGQAISTGSRLGTVEGFKAVSDLFSVIDGTFSTRNPLLTSEACLTHSDPYERGWLYTACGEHEPGHLDVHGYIAHLQETIDRLQASRYSAGDMGDS